MDKKYLLIGIIILALAVGIFFLFYDSDPCTSITDSSQHSDCYIDLAVTTGDISYCDVNYYTLDCITETDPLHQSDKETATVLCQKITDTSTRNTCQVYVDENY